MIIKNHLLGIIALIVGACALTLGILADLEKQEMDEIKERYEQPEKFEVKINKLAFTIGRKSPEEAPPAIPKYPPFLISSWAVSMFGLILAPISWVKERQKVLSGLAVVFCLMGLAWHYVAIAIAILVILIILCLVGL